MIHLDYRDARPIYSQIVAGIQSQVLSGILQQGDKLPSVRELASQLTINPNTIQRAYRELEMGGWVATVPGKGCFVCGIPTHADTHRDTLLQTFCQAARELQALGMTPEELSRLLTEGGNDHA